MSPDLPQSPRPGHPAAVLFDCDGVLVETEVTSARVMARLLTEHGVPTDQHLLRTVIKGTSLEFLADEAARRLGGTLPGGFMETFIEARLVEYRAGVEQIAGAAHAVASVLAASIPVAVVSQGAHAKMAVTLPSSGMDAVLGSVPIFSGQDVERGKPHPDLYLHAAATLRLDPSACVVVEDSPTGATGAFAAGMRVLGFSDDSDPEAMRAAGAEVFFDMAEVPALLGLTRATS